MGENQMLRLAVLQFVARLAERNAVRDVESQFRVVGKGLDVMGVKIPAARIAAPLASEVVAAEHVETPSLVLQRDPLPHAFGVLAIFVTMARITAWRALSYDGADFASSLDRVPDTRALGWLAYSRERHFLFRFVSVVLPFEGGNSATERRIRIIGRTAGLADRSKAIPPASVNAKAIAFNPTAAGVAPLKALLNSSLVFFHAYTDALCGNLHCTRFASHINS